MFECSFERANEGGGAVFLTRGDQFRQKIYNADRGIDVQWSPIDAYFAVLDHATGHSVDIRIYKISKVTVGHQETFKVDMVYESPLPGEFDIYWGVEKWNLAKGSVLLKCRYSSTGDPAKHVWKEAHWEIPIVYLGTDDVTNPNPHNKIFRPNKSSEKPQSR
ncbi:MAG: hypothetical protein WCP45_16045 [Verrucomicrobiota bacterium]